MAYTYSIVGVLALVRQLVVSALTAQSAAPGMAPFSFVGDQYPTRATDLPMTVIEVGKGRVDRRNGPAERTFELPVKVHYFLSRSANGNAEMTAMGLLSAIAAQCENDPRLSYLSPSIAIRTVAPELPCVTERMLAGMQNVAIAHAELTINVSWEEFR